MTQQQVAPSGGQNPYNVNLYAVITPTGGELNLQTVEEADWYERRRDRYINDNAFPNVSDLQDLDRLLVLELMVERWSRWISQGFNYQVARVDERELKDNIKGYSTEIRLLKASLGIDKATRDKEKGESLADYVASLLERAKIFGYHRNAQYELAVTKFYQLHTMVLTYDRCDEEERNQLGLSQDTIIEWIRDHIITEWDAMSEAFRKEQAIWIRDM